MLLYQFQAFEAEDAEDVVGYDWRDDPIAQLILDVVECLDEVAEQGSRLSICSGSALCSKLSGHC